MTYSGNTYACLRVHLFPFPRGAYLDKIYGAQGFASNANLAENSTYRDTVQGTSWRRWNPELGAFIDLIRPSDASGCLS